MPRTTSRREADCFSFRVDPELKAAFAAEARRQSRLIAERAVDPARDEAAVRRWMEDVSDTQGWAA